MIFPHVASRYMIGRDAELELLHERRRALSGRRGSVVLVGGEAGMGKTRLLEAFLSAGRGGRAPRYGAGDALQDAPRPFGPFCTALGQLLASAPHALDGAPIVRRTLCALVPHTVEEIAGAVPARETLEKAELFAGVLRFLETLAEKRATVIALEDLHWADDATLELLCFLAPRIATMRVLIVATHRDDEISTEHRLYAPIAKLMREQTVHRIALEPLTPRELRRLIDEAVGRGVLPSDDVRAVLDLSDGNPLFAIELIDRALSGSAVRPLSMAAITLQRIADLSPQERGILDAAAVLGSSSSAATLSSVALLASATACSRRAVEAMIRRLRDRGILADRTSEGSIRFRHALTRQTIYEQIPVERARSIHGCILDALERADGGLDALAYHAWCSGSEDKTQEYGERAGDAALGMAAADLAAQHFERALHVAPDDAARARLLAKCGEAYLQQSDFDRASSAFEACERMMLAAGDTDGAARAVSRRAAEMANGGKVHEALATLAAFDADHGSTLGQAVGSHFNSTYARLATAAGDFDLARRALVRVGDPDALEPFTHQVFWLAKLFLAEHDLDAAAWRDAADALERRNAETYPLMRSQLLHSIASTAILFAENERALRAVDAAIAIDREYGFARALAFAHAVKASVLTVCGRIAAARACIQLALAEPEMFVVRLELSLGSSPAAMAAGDEALVDQLLEPSLGAKLREGGMASAARLFDGMRAIAAFERGETARGNDLLDAALDGDLHPFAVVHFLPHAARYADAKRLIELRDALARGVVPMLPVQRGCATLLDGVAHGDASPAAADAAARLYRGLSWPLHEALALEYAGRGAEALKIYRRQDSTRDIRRLAKGGNGATKRVTGALSVREGEVAALIAQGQSNKGIAERLNVTEKTVEKHVTSIYAKLGFSTRTQLAAHLTRPSV